MRDLTVISEILNATDEGLSGADIYKALQDRMTAWRVYKTGVRHPLLARPRVTHSPPSPLYTAVKALMAPWKIPHPLHSPHSMAPTPDTRPPCHSLSRSLSYLPSPTPEIFLPRCLTACLLKALKPNASKKRWQAR